jgi:general secretion pathway protein G
MRIFSRADMKIRSRKAVPSLQTGMTLLELIIACAILLVLSSAALPIARFTIVRQRENELRYDLRDMRRAIDRYKDYADRGLLRTEVGSENYPPDLETLVKGVALGGAGAAGKNVRFLRRVPVDPMTGHADWGKRAVQDDPDSNSWGGRNVFDVYSTSTGIALDGTKYSDW